MTTSASNQHSKARNTGKEEPQHTHKDQQSHAQASSSHQTPMLREWLDREKLKGKDASKLGDRDEYAKGEAGMSKYLVHWDRAWHRMGRKADGQKES